MCNGTRGWDPAARPPLILTNCLLERAAAGTATIIPTAAKMLLFLELITATET